MSPDAQRIAIAKALGRDVIGWRFFWRVTHRDDEWHESPTYVDQQQMQEAVDYERGWGREIRDIAWFEAPAMCPNYPNNLNACADIEKGLTPEQAGAYVSELARMIGKIETRTREFHVAYVCATATQRCEAFLRTLNLWDDTK